MYFTKGMQHALMFCSTMSVMIGYHLGMSSWQLSIFTLINLALVVNLIIVKWPKNVWPRGPPAVAAPVPVSPATVSPADIAAALFPDEAVILQLLAVRARFKSARQIMQQSQAEMSALFDEHSDCFYDNKSIEVSILEPLTRLSIDMDHTWEGAKMGMHDVDRMIDWLIDRRRQRYAREGTRPTW